jgi:thiol-disulfide isomerase/thioredoxin
MFDRRLFLIAVSGAMILGSAVSSSAAEVAFTQQAFDAAQKAGKPILVHITATWCSTCKAQKPIVSELTAAPKFKNMTVFDVDFDSQKSVVREFRAQAQSTLITFKGEKETGRSVGDTNAGSIAALLDKSI